MADGNGPPTLQRAASSATLAQQNAHWHENDENIGFYLKAGFCYSDVKSFVPSVLALAQIAVWFSDKKTTVLDKELKQRRKDIITQID